MENSSFFRSLLELRALSTAVFGALLATEAVLVLDRTPLARHLESYRRIVAVAIKTFLYGAITFFLGFLERLVEARYHQHTFGAGYHYAIAQASLDRLLAWSLGIAIVFGVYFALFEISERMGEGELWALFLRFPKLHKPASSGD